jgi:hypothetical protein
MIRRNKCQNGKHPKGILWVFFVINAREILEWRKLRLERLHNVFMMIVRIKILKKFNDLSEELRISGGLWTFNIYPSLNFSTF